jgi:hypothetical protein
VPRLLVALQPRWAFACASFFEGGNLGGELGALQAQEKVGGDSLLRRVEYSNGAGSICCVIVSYRITCIPAWNIL